MRNNLLFTGLLILAVFFIAGCASNQNANEDAEKDIIPGTTAAALSESQELAPGIIKLPEPRYDGETSVEKAMKNRRSVRQFTSGSIDLKDVSQLLWAAQGITSEDGKRTAPSAQKLYPLEVYLIVLNVNGLAGGTYHYVPKGHLLETIQLGDMSSNGFTTAPAAFVIAANLEKRPGPRPAMGNGTGPINVIPMEAPPGNNASGANMPPMNGSAPKGGGNEPSAETVRSWYYAEIGHAAQNMYLQSESLDLGMVTQAGFSAEKLDQVLEFPENVTPYYVIPVGHTN